MKKLVVALLLAASLSPTAHAITRGCTAAMVSLGLCRTTSDAVMCVAASTVDPDNGGPRLAPTVLVPDAIADNNGWSANMTCTQEMVDAVICNSGQLGTPVAVTKVKFTDMIIRRFILAQVKAYRLKQEHAIAETTAQTEPAPDVGN